MNTIKQSCLSLLFPRKSCQSALAPNLRNKGGSAGKMSLEDQKNFGYKKDYYSKELDKIMGKIFGTLLSDILKKIRDFARKRNYNFSFS